MDRILACLSEARSLPTGPSHDNRTETSGSKDNWVGFFSFLLKKWFELCKRSWLCSFRRTRPFCDCRWGTCVVPNRYEWPSAKQLLDSSLVDTVNGIIHHVSSFASAAGRLELNFYLISKNR